jgi:hypothetical protein
MSWHSASDEHLTNSPQNMRGPSYKSAQIPLAYRGCVLLGVLKAVEVELAKRELLGTLATQATPLWFIAETERNVFLWRNGKSIGDHSTFSFWIDIKALINKRRSHLSRSRGFNPFINLSPRSGGIDCEHRYLDAIEELCDTIFRHAEVISQASESIRKELSPDRPTRSAIVLPHVKGVTDSGSEASG